MNRNFILLTALVFLFGVFANAYKPVPRFELKKEKGSLYERVESMAKNQPARDSNAFRPPAAEQQKTWKRIVQNIFRARLNDAVKELNLLAPEYDLIVFADESTKREYVVLEERTLKNGWGFYVFDPQSKSPLAIEVTHPVADARTELEGIDVFLNTGASAFLMAGTHRRANQKETACSQPATANNPDPEGTDYPESDVAHNTSTIFQAVHEALIEEKPKTVAVQLHGMAERSICPNIFISSGTSKPTANSSRLLNCLAKQKVEAGLYEGAADACPLGAKTNVQGRFSNGEKQNPCERPAAAAPEPGFFLHVEQEPGIRRDRSSWQPVINALKCAFAS